MARATRRRDATAMALSVAAHAVVLTALALHSPTLMRPYEEGGPPEPVIPVLIMPRTPPAPPGSKEAPRPIRLHRRQLRPDIAPPEIPPFVPPASVPTPPAPAPKAVGQPRVSVQPSPGSRVTAALRGGLVGCANPSLLNADERERCQERLGGGLRTAPAIGPVADPALERAAAARDADYAYRRRAPVPAAAPGAGGPGASAESITRNAGGDQPTLKLPF